MTTRIYARQTEVIELPIEDAMAFFALNHRSGALRITSGLYALGLLHNQQTVAAVLFGAPRTKKMADSYSFELLRMAFLEDSRVVGGASKPIAGFIKLKSPSDFFHLSVHGR